MFKHKWALSSSEWLQHMRWWALLTCTEHLPPSWTSPGFKDIQPWSKAETFVHRACFKLENSYLLKAKSSLQLSPFQQNFYSEAPDQAPLQRERRQLPQKCLLVWLLSWGFRDSAQVLAPNSEKRDLSGVCIVLDVCFNKLSAISVCVKQVVKSVSPSEYFWKKKWFCNALD